jgi:hypothetical protein
MARVVPRRAAIIRAFSASYTTNAHSSGRLPYATIAVSNGAVHFISFRAIDLLQYESAHYAGEHVLLIFF